MTINFGFDPAVGYSGKYTVVAYGINNLAIPLGQTSFTGPFGSHITGSIAGLPTQTSYQLKFFTDECTNPVGTRTVTP